MDPAVSMSALRVLFLESAKALRKLREKDAIRQKLLTLIFSITPADRAAVLVDDSLVVRGAEIRRGIVEQVFKDGEPFLSNEIVCVPMDGHDDHRLGVLYAQGSDSAEPFNIVHLHLLTGVAAIAALAFENASYIEVLREENSRLQRDLVGDSPAMAELSRIIAKTAPTNSTVLIQGETGTGKELVARAIHKNSKRADGPFIAVNCAAQAESLIESELFGHGKGAFTGAIAQKKGQFELAAGGTLFLDEVGELLPSIQAKLLRAIQEREIHRIGGTRPVPVDIRLIAASNRDLEAAAAKNEFRHDLLYRLKVITIKTPALRERREDIPALARHFVEIHRKRRGLPVRGVSPEAESMLINHDWPGNVRELQNAIERAIVLGSGDFVVPEDLPGELFESRSDGSPMPKYHEAINATKRDLIEKAFAHAGGDYKKAAALLGFENPKYILK